MRPCKHCGTNLDGDLIIHTFLSMGKTYDDAIECAKVYQGWEAHETRNRWGREIGMNSMELDRVVYYACPDCGGKV
jgi:DNA-directed RNA polymerase subunit RPC12/RpoP